MTFALVSLAVALVTGALSWVIWRLSLKYRLYPKIRIRDMHTRPTPRLGGIAMFLGILVGFGIASQLPYFRLVFATPEPILAILGASLLIVLIGVADDIWDLDWTTKLAGQLIAAGLIAWKGVQIVSLPIGGLTVGSPWMSLIITVLAIVLVTNALNFIDGLDGLVAGVALIANGVFFLYSYLLVQQTSPTDYFNLASLIAVVLVGACAGFLPINWRPARMFMGDSGALLVGMLMATSAIAVTGQIDPAQLAAKELLPAFIPIILPFAILVVPLMDFGLAVIRRLRAGKSPFSADRKHLHHRLLDMGHSHLHAVLIFYGWTAVVAISCLLMFVVDVLWVPLLFLGVGLLVCTVVTLAPLSRRKRWEAAAQSAEASPVLDPLDRASSTEQLRPPAGFPTDRDTTAPIVAQKEAS
ncbi:undecaprenyl/decaprenyl-phosphate alpha-N-acetylglucosaminyl 1-phosphate transferase [Rathayibacter rathayi]|uniref:Undecaprenyl/decaprenyl-phosphate alpha-N-acetylglucosaminyl 1-phosphate transferase n=1 Tax=Rathayibacter rathayi TaxID=33887 RepID=A0ABD6WCI2_RATRA|nr:undecaprenyl/decaprenyl-phosphate alpha-N-acetylglucosaminyl 1-phosphate transferase [Rathayibacter rathayi]MWV73238.1 undecaprenyl/decaprenyl-phosphate alpha-N-acetylglucosaminyl 1-phosphate transferase [Rathayibacter rathayi NCPPB 2980 = VKM Ac-1601]PPF16460.1 undecaprenyl/decaprenyl-phosphate alpha-N-acetylglucosaminyl 1-phosphate transferase [Rathayibacter rathayi]PPF25695.1 undecaprenyl/decaprenyl-phosphate alpha-N-acetylglucosaminyl 1-phosphate transferase [Rathayibacter rathayi]PPF520